MELLIFLGIVLAIVLSVAWTILPFAVIGVKKRLERLAQLEQMIATDTKTMLEEIKMIRTQLLGGSDPSSKQLYEMPSGPTDEELMADYGITFNGSQYVYKDYRYDKLSYAVDYAKKQKR